MIDPTKSKLFQYTYLYAGLIFFKLLCIDSFSTQEQVIKYNIFEMSANILKNPRKKYDDLLKKDLTPKNNKNSPKITPVYSSFRGGLTIKPDLIPKTKIVRPSTSKYSNSDNQNFFHSREDKKPNHSSTKKFSKDDSLRRPLNTTQYQYQPRSKSKSPLKQPQEIIKHQIEVKYPLQVATFRDIKSYNNEKPQLPRILAPISNFEKAKHSVKANGLIKAYAASTNQGPVRQYNQDRVAIILNIAKPEHCIEWKKAAYFGVFDGHGGVDCADFLRDNLHIYVSRQRSFPDDIQNALKIGFEKCQRTFIEHSKVGKLDRSGSCAIVTFFYGNMLYVANVGDSRAIMSSKFGDVISQLSIDHKANCEYQQKRIFDAGGKIYQTRLQHANPNIKIFYQGQQHAFVMGPHRVMPGRLSVTRTFGDIQAKLPQLKGNPKAIINEPEVRTVKITSDQDFVLLASDGIFDKISNSEVIQMIWDTLRRDEGKFKNIHQFCGLAVENIMKLAFNKKTLDNITVVLVALQGLERYFAQREAQLISAETSFNKTLIPDSRRDKSSSKYQSQFERRYIGRSTSPTNYSSLRSHSFYRN